MFEREKVLGGHEALTPQVGSSLPEPLETLAPQAGLSRVPCPLPPPSFSFWCAFLCISSQSKLLNIAEVKGNSIQVIKKNKLLLELGVFTDCFLPSEILSSYFPYPLGHVSFSTRKQPCIFFLITLGSFGMWLRIHEAFVSVITQNT